MSTVLSECSTISVPSTDGDYGEQVDAAPACDESKNSIHESKLELPLPDVSSPKLLPTSVMAPVPAITPLQAYNQIMPLINTFDSAGKEQIYELFDKGRYAPLTGKELEGVSTEKRKRLKKEAKEMRERIERERQTQTVRQKEYLQRISEKVHSLFKYQHPVTPIERVQREFTCAVLGPNYLSNLRELEPVPEVKSRLKIVTSNPDPFVDMPNLDQRAKYIFWAMVTSSQEPESVINTIHAMGHGGKEDKHLTGVLIKQCERTSQVYVCSYYRDFQAKMTLRYRKAFPGCRLMGDTEQQYKIHLDYLLRLPGLLTPYGYTSDELTRLKAFNYIKPKGLVKAPEGRKGRKSSNYKINEEELQSIRKQISELENIRDRPLTEKEQADLESLKETADGLEEWLETNT